MSLKPHNSSVAPDETKELKENYKSSKTFRYSPNKEAPFYASFLKGSYTLEAAIIVPLFITAMLFVVFLFRVLQVQAGVQQALDDASREVAITAETIAPEGQLTAAKTQALLLVKVYGVPTQYIRGGVVGINLIDSSTEGNYVDLKAKYSLRFPIGLLGRLDYKVVQESRNRKWIGYDPLERDSDDGFVYVAEHGTVYHLSPNCTHINPSIRAAKADVVSEKRNNSGGKYYSCSDCKGDKNAGTVYITDYGTNYHSDINCTGLKRTVRKVPLEDVKDSLPVCRKCTGLE